jgi:CDP-glucose 4,6-dehydratase
MHYLITGHTGFKGSWLALMLQMQGHTVSGISLDPQHISLFNQANLKDLFEHDFRLNIRNSQELQKAVKKIDPEVIIHLAAQPLVRESYKDPIGTFETNVLGTLNLLEATKNLFNLKATLIITTDKVYKNQGHLRGYVETDELGGDDPYSASKAAADLATQSWTKSFGETPISIVRAGNVIGGGDWGKDRLIPDLVKAYSAGKVPKIRFPKSIRPWQHVLDCLNGYLAAVNAMLESQTSGIWNFGPESKDLHTVQELVEEFAALVNHREDNWAQDYETKVNEASFLVLDSSKAKLELGWANKLSWNESLRLTSEYYFTENVSQNELLIKQIDFFTGRTTKNV